MATKAAKRASTRRLSKLDLKKPLKVAIAQHVGIHRRDVDAAFRVMGSLIEAELSKSGSGVFKVPADAHHGQAEGGHQGAPGDQPLHEGADGLQGQAGAERRAGASPPGAQGDGVTVPG